MSRKLFVLLTLVLIGGFVVAFVRAQESSRRRTTVGSRPKSSPSETSPPSSLRPPTGGATIHFGDGQAQPTQSTQSQPTQAQPSAKSAPSSRGSSLADRLKTIRRNSPTGGVSQPSSQTTLPASPTQPSLPTEPEMAEQTQQPAPVISSPSVVQQTPVVAPSIPLRDESSQDSSGQQSRTALRSVLQRNDEVPDSRSPDRYTGPPASVVELPTNVSPAPPAASAYSPPIVPEATSRRAVQAPGGDQMTRSPLRDDTRQSSGEVSSSRTPSIQIETTGPKAIVIGKEATYTVTISNLGSSMASNLTLTLQVPDWVEIVANQTSRGSARRVDDIAGQLVWNIDALQGRTREQWTVNLVPQANRPFEVAIDWTFVPETAVARIEVQQPELELLISGAEEVQFGKSTSYTITIRNPGTGDAENVVLILAPFSPQQQTSQSSQIGTIPAGGEKQFQLEFNALQAGQAEIRASAVGDGSLQAEAVATVFVRRADLQVDAGGPRLKFSGSVIAYQVVVTNRGDAVAEDVILAATLPGGAKYVGGSKGAQPTSGGVIWPLGELQPGDQRSFEIQCELHSAGDNRLEIAVQGAGDLTARDMVVTRVEAIAELKLTVIEPKGPQPVGEEVIYEIHLVNRGTESARQVSVITQFSDGIEPVATDGGGAEIVPGQVLFDPIQRLGPGEERILRVSARADKAGSHVFRTEVKCNDPETRLASEGTTRFFSDENLSARTATVPRVLEVNPAPAQQIGIRR